VFFWGTPSKFAKIRAWVLIIFSSIFLFTIAPYATLGVMLLCAFLVGLSKILVLEKFNGSKVFYSFIFLLIVFFSLVRFLEGDLGLFLTLGLTFTLLRAIVLLYYVRKKKVVLTWTNTFLYLLFFPTYSAGPIAKRATITMETISANIRFAPIVFTQGVLRLMFGFFKVIYLSSLITPSIEQMSKEVYNVDYTNGSLYVLGFCLLKFLNVYINFSGYSDIAIGSGRMLGFKIMENFNSPFLATNIIDFWQRWHMSLGFWIRTYLYMPLIRNFGKIYMSIFVAFLLVGLWHNYTINYFIWGIGHGAALAITQFVKRKGYLDWMEKSVSILQLIFKNLSRVFILTYVSILSVFANSSSFENGLIFMKNLF